MKIKIISGIVLITMLGFFTQVKAQYNAETERQITALLLEKNSRTPTQQKIESRLLQAVRESRGEKMAPGVDLFPANVKADATGHFDVDITAPVTDVFLTKLEQLGAVIIYPSWNYGTTRARISFNMVETIAGYAEVKFIAAAEEAMTVGNGLKSGVPVFKSPVKKQNVAPQRIPFEVRAKIVREKLKKILSKYNKTSLLVGSANSQGDRAHRADDVRSTYGYEGQGIRIGIMSDSYNNLGAAATDVANGDLPGPGNPYGNTTAVTVVQDLASGGSDEGRAMTQIVHDLAPKAQLFFATAYSTQANFATNIQALRNAPNNCDIILDDIFYYAEPVFQDGIIAQAVTTVTTAGCLYFSSAGNEGSVLRSTSGYFEGDFNDAGSPVFTHPGGKLGTIHNFGTLAVPVNGDIVTLAGNAYNLSWADPTGASANDYDLFLVSSAGAVKASSTTVQSGTQNPYEQITPLTLVAGDRLVVFKTTTAAIRAFAINTIRGRLTNFTTGQVHGHCAAVNAFAVAATPAATPFGATTAGPYPSAFVGTNQVETFSSDGPRRVFYDAAGTAITPGNFLFGTNGGTVRNKPDITAADGVATTLAAGGGLNPFYGTSASAPHAGAIAALIKAANPALTTTQMRTILTTNTVDIEAAGWDINSGYGIVQAFQSVQASGGAGVSNIRVGTATATEGASGTNGNTYIEPGENGSIVVQLTNPSLVSASAVTGTLTTNTPGITITQGSASYGTIGSGSNASNTGTPYTFTVDPSVACGTLINFFLSAGFGGGGPSPQSGLFTVRVGNASGSNINGTTGVAAPTVTGYTTSSGNQTGRLSRSGVIPSCATPKANPGLTATTGARAYHAYTITNTNAASQCVTVTMSSANAGTLFTAVYDNNGFVPAVPSTNFLADAGASNSPQTFTFTAPAGQAFTVVVHEINVGTTGSVYNLNISYAACAAALPVSWVDFTAQLVNKQVALQWKVENELNLSHYEVEYSADGRNFTKFAQVNASPLSTSQKTYNQLHTSPVPGYNYYRIKQVDKDGRYSYSGIISLRIKDDTFVSISPNPASTFVNVKSADKMKQIQVIGLAGQVIKTVKPGADFYTLKINELAAGYYTLKIETDKGTTINQKFVKE